MAINTKCSAVVNMISARCCAWWASARQCSIDAYETSPRSSGCLLTVYQHCPVNIEPQPSCRRDWSIATSLIMCSVTATVMSLFWFRVARRGREVAGSRQLDLSQYPRGDMLSPIRYTIQTQSPLVPCNLDRGSCFP